jgi:SAM-dependent methyltransferase
MLEATMVFYRQFLQSLNRAMVLDLGAGIGKVATGISAMDQVETVIAYDTGPEPMRALKESAKVRKEVSGNYTQLPFGDQTFDAVICRYVLHHFEKKERALAEVKRVLKPNGVLLLSDAILPEHSRDALASIYRIREDQFYGYLTYFELICLLEASGLSPLLSRPYRYGYANLSDYLKAVDNGMAESLQHVAAESVNAQGSESLAQPVADILKWKIRRAFFALDETVQREIGVIRNDDGSDLSFQYFMLDVAAKAQVCSTK